ncbi:hypothetical protein AMTR_s00031p00054170 [Amborella trichopoda]|uniref:Uncharacterized protein n=1 Tax=Amborella trichopoda TaxID=13333 RepID=U5D255_AMBTC|nr:hypothetical protein AMTR_s00031p00054170 [Amborella trichopoda]
MGSFETPRIPFIRKKAPQWGAIRTCTNAISNDAKPHALSFQLQSPRDQKQSHQAENRGRLITRDIRPSWMSSFELVRCS